MTTALSRSDLQIVHHILQDVARMDIPAESSVAQGKAIEALRTCVLKKYVGAKLPTAKVRAIEGFIQRGSTTTLINEPLLGAKAFLRSLFEDDNFITEEEIFEGMRVGPGVAQTLDWTTNAYHKLFRGRITCSTPELYSEYLTYLRKFSFSWYKGEINRALTFGSVVFRDYSRVITVPKDNEIDRVIAVEPVINSVMQQGLKAVLESRLRLRGIDLSSQPTINRSLARIGSMDGSLATIDLSAASDSISTHLLRKLFPDYVVDLVSFYSTSAYSIGREKHLSSIALSMGNAITFPLQTLVFLSLVVQAYKNLGLRYRIGENVAVFGDDIIVSTPAYDEVIRILRACGFLPNPKKCFAEGSFRESCGGDYWEGFNIRPVYCKSLDSVHDVYVVRNLLAAWSQKTGISLGNTLWRIDGLLKKRGLFHPVPPWDALDAGIRCEEPPGSPCLMPKRKARNPWYGLGWMYSRLSRVSRGRIPPAIFADGYGCIASYWLGAFRRTNVNDGLSSHVEETWAMRNKTLVPSRVRTVHTSRWNYVNDEDLRLYDWMLP